MRFADIIVNVSHENVDKSFQYVIPQELETKVHVGVQVRIPFGKGNREITGFVIRISGHPSIEIEKLKAILCVEEKTVHIESEMIQTAWFIRHRYGATMNQALKIVLPVKEKIHAVVKRTLEFTPEYQPGTPAYQERKEKYQRKRATQRLALLEKMEAGEKDWGQLSEQYGFSLSMVKDMEQQGILKISSRQVYRNPLQGLVDYRPDTAMTQKDAELILNEEQQRIVSNITKSSMPVHLVHGVTGSGKTRVYIALIREVLQQGKQAIVMIPEISLTYQTVKRFFDVFGDRISIIHSKLSAGERYDQFERAKKGDIQLMIGPRSAVFTPFSNLGIIIIDEEHESSYKSENMPRYHARDVAIFRAGLHGAKVVLGSATPSVETYYRASRQEYALHTMTKRAAGQAMPDVIVTDLREELEAGNKTIFSRRLDELILDRLRKKEQIMLFINRRGYAGFVSCRSCGEAIKCPHCDVSLTYHNTGYLQCHYCGYQIPMPKQCPACASKYIARFGTGTEKVEEYVKKYYPSARVLRMDADTTSAKGAHEKLIAAFSRHEADILVGTQMIVKGHDFPRVTLVGVIAADLSLYASDYRAAERTFQLLTQAEGRAGRGSLAGTAVIQTYNTENFSIQTAAKQDYYAFYEKELLYRTLMEYPPVMQMLAVLVTSKEEKQGELLCERLKKRIESMEEDYKLIGPAPAELSKLKDVYRRVLYIKHPSLEKIIELKEKIEEHGKVMSEGIRADMSFDLNPLGGY